MQITPPNRILLIAMAVILITSCGDPVISRPDLSHADPTPLAGSRPKTAPTEEVMASGMLDLTAFPVDRRLGGPFLQPDPNTLDQDDYRLVDAVLYSEASLVPNCAGYYHVMVVGCGTSCHRLCFFDLRDGGYVSEMTIVFSCGMSTWVDDPLETYLPDFDVNSRIVMVPCIVGHVEGCHFFEIVDRTLIPLTTVPWNSSWNQPASTGVSHD